MRREHNERGEALSGEDQSLAGFFSLAGFALDDSDLFHVDHHIRLDAMRWREGGPVITADEEVVPDEEEEDARDRMVDFLNR